MNARLRRGLLLTGIGLILVYAWMLLVADEAGLAKTIARSDPRLLPLPLIATLLSYVTMSLSYEGIARAAGAESSSRDMLRITFVANTANYVLPTGGLSGFALRLVFLSKKGMPGGRAVLVCFTQTLLTNLMLMVFVVYGLVHLILSGRLTGAAIIALSVLVTGLTAFLCGCMLDGLPQAVASTAAVVGVGRSHSACSTGSAGASRSRRGPAASFSISRRAWSSSPSRPRAMIMPLRVDLPRLGVHRRRPLHLVPVGGRGGHLRRGGHRVFGRNRRRDRVVRARRRGRSRSRARGHVRDGRSSH